MRFAVRLLAVPVILSLLLIKTQGGRALSLLATTVIGLWLAGMAYAAPRQQAAILAALAGGVLGVAVLLLITILVPLSQRS